MRLRCEGDAPTIVEYALAETPQPIGVATYTLSEALPKDLEGMLPTVEQLEAQLERVKDEP